jgi:hypothetical protein
MAAQARKLLSTDTTEYGFPSEIAIEHGHH